MRRAAPVLALLVAATLAGQTPAAPRDPVPQSVDEFQRAAAGVLHETGVPGAGIALVRNDGVEWAGGIGVADRALGTPVTADTVFRVGSVSKTFVAMALVQLSEDGRLELDTPVRELAPEVDIDNPWEDIEPVQVIHLLQHTAGFDDMHFNEIYVPPSEADRPLIDVLRINPRSRRVRWPPGTRMAYSNPGYAVAGVVLENVAGQPFEQFIAENIFEPLGMTNSTFAPVSGARAALAQGYRGPEGPAVDPRAIYLRPAGQMSSSAHDLGRFVQMLLGWGELGDAFVIDPEYLGNMEQPQTTLAAAAGLRNGYGSGIFTMLELPYKMLGHNGGIDGFLASYAYSPSRDVGYVVLLNSGGAAAADAMQRLSSLALSYLKRDVEPPAKPAIAVDPSVLDRYVGYYHDANPRNEFLWPLQSLFSGHTVARRDNTLHVRSLQADETPLVAVTESSFRLEHELDASRIFTQTSAGQMVMAGGSLYAERVSRWPFDLLRVSLATALVVIASVFPVAVVWVARLKRAAPRGFWELKIALLLCPLVVLMPVAALGLTPPLEWGEPNTGTRAVYAGTLAIPAMAFIVALLTALAIRERPSRRLVTYAGLVALSMAGIALFLSRHDLIGLKTWAY